MGKSIKEYEKFLFKTLDKYMIAKEYLLDKKMISIKEIMRPKTIKEILKLQPFNTSYSYIASMIHNEKLKNYLLFQAMYIGINPFKDSSVYSIIPAITAEYGLYHVKGGFYNYILALEKLIGELGGSIEKNTYVTEILQRENKIHGVKTTKGFYRADIVVCNADFPYAIENLFSDDIREGSYSRKNIAEKPCSYAVFMIYLGLRKKYLVLTLHNIFINKELEVSFNEPLAGKLPRNPSLYMYYPSALDDSFCVAGKSVLNIMVRVPNLGHKNIMWNEEDKINYGNKIIKIIKSIPGMEDIEENIEFKDYLTPIDLKKRFNAYKGNSFGLSHKLLQSTYLRPHLKSKSIRGLYYIGSSTHPGNGASVIIDGSRILTKLIEEVEE